jgi:hypothetical protein
MILLDDIYAAFAEINGSDPNIYDPNIYLLVTVITKARQ